MTMPSVVARLARTGVQPVLSMRGVRKSFSRGLARAVDRTVALTGVDLDLHAGEIVAVTGDEGAGKTALLQCAAGLLRRDAGEVRWFGKSFEGGGPCPDVSYVAAVPVFYPFFTVRDVLEMRAGRELERTAGEPRIDDALFAFSLGTQAERRIMYLSPGELRRVALAEALVSRPRAVLVDTSFSGIGSVEACIGLADFASSGGAVMVAARDPASVASVATRFAIMSEGRLSPGEAWSLPQSDGRIPRRRFVAEQMH